MAKTIIIKKCDCGNTKKKNCDYKKAHRCKKKKSAGAFFVRRVWFSWENEKVVEWLGSIENQLAQLANNIPVKIYLHVHHRNDILAKNSFVFISPITNPIDTH